jgi:nucleoid-associated protein YgaU
MTVTVLPRQTLSDIAIQVYGDVSGVVELAAANNIGITSELTPGQELVCPEVIHDNYMQNYVRKRGIAPATK